MGKPVVDTCIAGYNGTIFAYGQTGSGKTFTIQGGVRENGQLIPELRGLVPRSFEYLFKAINREEQTVRVHYAIRDAISSRGHLIERRSRRILVQVLVPGDLSGADMRSAQPDAADAQHP